MKKRFIFTLLTLVLVTSFAFAGVVNGAEDSYTLTAAVSGSGEANFAGADSVAVAPGSAVSLTVTPAEGWYVSGITDSAGTALTVSETGGTLSYLPASDSTLTVTFSQYAALYERADGSVSEYTKTLSAAAKLAVSDADTVTLLRDVSMGSADYIGSGYRLELNQGFILDLDGHVLSSDKSLLRLLNSNTTKVSTMTIRNGTMTAAVASTSQHMITLMNHAGLVLQNVQAYCGAFYTNGKVVVNTDEVAVSSSGVSAVVITNGDGAISFTDSLLCTYGNYYVFQTNNKNAELPKAPVTVKNSSLITYGSKTVFGCADSREYTVTFLDEKSVLTSRMATGGDFHACAAARPYSGYSIMPTGSYTDGTYTLYNYTHVPVARITWLGFDGQLLETDTDVAMGAMPEYNSATPTKPADSTYAYVFTGWSPALSKITGDATYTAQFAPVPVGYTQTGIDMITETDLYKIQGRPYVTDRGLNMDFAGAAFEFEADLAGPVTVTYSAKLPVYFQVYLDGQPAQRVCLPKGDNLIGTVLDFVDADKHSIRVVRDTDAWTGGQYAAVSQISFMGKPDTRKTIAAQDLFIEFVGDSITAGKYTEMQYVEGDAIHKATNSYAYLTAEAMGADYSIVARGGCGYFRVSSCPKPAHALYPYYNGFLSEPVAYTPQRQADVVVLALGTNDTSSAVSESYANGIVPFSTFVDGVRYVIGQIRTMHGQDVKIVLLHNMMLSSWESQLRTAAELEGVFFLQVTQDRTGGNNHPSTAGHQVIARELTAFLEESVFTEVSISQKGKADQEFSSLQAAVDSLKSGQYIRLTGDVTEDVVIKKDVYLDLNGFTLTGNISGTGTLYGMDTSGDAYTFPTGSIRGTVTCNTEQVLRTRLMGPTKQYLALGDSQGYTFHRIGAEMTHMSMRPTENGVGYKAMFACDSAVEALLDKSAAYGFSLWLGAEGEKHSVSKGAGEFISGKTVSLLLGNFDVENHSDTEIFGQVFLKLADGTVIESNVQSFTLHSFLEEVAGRVHAYTPAQVASLKAFVARYETTMKEWAVEALR